MRGGVQLVKQSSEADRAPTVPSLMLRHVLVSR